MNSKENSILKIRKADQYSTVDELIKRSQPTSIYYTLLILSSFIVASGLLLNNATIVIGGMLITPVLSPMLLIALGVSIGRPDLIKQVIISTIKSFLIIMAASLLLTLLFGSVGSSFALENTIRTAALYFIVALTAGIAATFAWARKEIAEVLPGIAIAVSLVPPLSLIGIGLSSLDLEVVRFNLFIFLFNLIGVLVGSLIVFSLLKFYKTEKEVEKKVEETDGAAVKPK